MVNYERRIMLVTVHCEGVDGWGECVTGEEPYYSSECIDTSWPVMEVHLVPMILGKTVATAGEIVGLMSKVRGHRMAKAAIENALWEVEAKTQGVPLAKLLGGTRKEIMCGVSIGIQNTVDDLMEKIAIEIAAGYRRIKVKVKPGWDVNVLEKIRSRWSDILLSCDANSAYRMDENNQDGLRLILLDEAFDKMDTPNIVATMRYLEKLGLQVLLASPGENLPTLTAFLHRYFEIMKDETQHVIQVEERRVSEAMREQFREDMWEYHPELLEAELLAVRQEPIVRPGAAPIP